MFAGTNKAPLKNPTRSHYEIITSSCYRFFKQLNFHNNMKKCNIPYTSFLDFCQQKLRHLIKHW